MLELYVSVLKKQYRYSITRPPYEHLQPNFSPRLIPGAGFVDPNRYSGQTEPQDNLLEARKQDIEKAMPPKLTEKDIQALLDKGRAPYKDTGRTRAGRGIDKHGMRPESAFPQPKGGADDVNRQGIKEIGKNTQRP